MADSFQPPQGAVSNAKRGLELRREFNRGGTAVGVARARSLANGQGLPLETIRRMVSYFARHELIRKGKIGETPLILPLDILLGYCGAATQAKRGQIVFPREKRKRINLWLLI
jgi:hypothetical protein